MWPELEGVQPMHPITLRTGTCHSWPRALPNTSQKSHELVGTGNREKGGAQGYSDFRIYAVRVEFRNSSWMGVPSPKSTSPVFAPKSLHLARHPCLMPPLAGPPHQKTCPPHRVCKPLRFTSVRKSIFIDC